MIDYSMHGGIFSPLGYTRINEGGSHDENPNGGVQLGVDPEGIPNMVEEDESIYKDFVYSDNIKIDEAMLEKHNLPKKYAGKLYSEAADAILSDVEDMTTDEIALRGMEAHLSRLAEAQEEQKQLEQQKELEEQLASLSPEELAQLEALLTQQDAQAVAEQDVVPEQMIMPEQIAQPQIMANGGLLRVFDDGTPGQVTTESVMSRRAQAEKEYAEILEREKTAQKDARLAAKKKKLEDDIARIQKHVNRDEKKLNELEESFSNPFMHKSNIPSMLELVKKQAGLVDYNKARLKKVQDEYDAEFGEKEQPVVVDTDEAPLNFNDEPTTVSQPANTSVATPVSSKSVFDWSQYADGGLIRSFATGSPEGEVLPSISVSAQRRQMPSFPVRAVALNPPGIRVPSLSNDIEIEDEPLKINDEPLFLYTGIDAPSRIQLRTPVDLDSYRVPVEDEVVDDDSLPLLNKKPEPERFDFRRYADAGRNLAMAFYNMSQPVDKLNIPVMRNRFENVQEPVLIDPEYRPTDRNKVINDILAAGAGTAKQVAASGNPITVGANLAAIDAATTRAIGEGSTKVDEANNALRNTIIGAKNSNILQRANARYQQAQARAHYLANLDRFNIQNNILGQQYEDQGEANWAQAVSSPLNAVTKFLQDDYLEDRRRNSANATDTFGYWMDQLLNRHYGKE